MSPRNPFSKLKKLKRRLFGGGNEPATGGTNTDGERVDGTGLPSQLVPYLIAEGEDNRLQSGSADPSPRSDDPGPVPVGESGYDRGEIDAITEGRGADERGSDLRSSVEDVVVIQSGSSQEGDSICGETADRINPPPSDGTQTKCYFSHYL